MSSFGLFQKPLKRIALAGLFLMALALVPDPGVTADAAARTSRPVLERAARTSTKHTSHNPRKRIRQSTAGSAGMLIGRDPETGAIGPPSAEQRRILLSEGAARDRSGSDLEVIRLPDGTRLVHLDDRFMEYSVARRDPGGRIRMGCVAGPEAARRFIGKTPPVPAPRPVEE